MGLFSKKRHSWEIELLQKAGNVDIANNEAWKDFVVMKEYAETFLSWLENIVSNPKRQIELVDRQIFDANALKRNFDYNSIINCPDINSVLSEKEINQKLSAFSAKQVAAENNSGIGILLNSLYKICE